MFIYFSINLNLYGYLFHSSYIYFVFYLLQSLVFYFIMFALLLACTRNLVPRAVDVGKLQKIMPSTYRPFVASLSVALVSSTIKCKISEDKYDFWFPMGVLYWTRIKHQLRLWTLLYTRTLRWHTHTHTHTHTHKKGRETNWIEISFNTWWIFTRRIPL